MEERKNEKNGRMDEFTWQQVAKHNSNESCWVINKGLVYDVTCFIDSHPGGRHLLLLCAGRDITDLFIPYHWNTSTPSLVLKKYLIGKVINHEFPSFKPDSGFYSTLSKRVHQHFVETNQDPKDMRASVSRLIPMIALAMVCYHLQFFTDLYLPGKYLFAILYGVLQALPLLHSMHDACHSAISHSPNIWYSISHFTMDVFAGASINSWMHQHFLSHHVYTNVSELDSDLPISLQGDFRRIYQDQKWNWIYKYQYIYLPIVYSFLTIKFRLEDLSCTLMMKPNGVIRVAPIKPFNVFEQVYLINLVVCQSIVYILENHFTNVV